MAAQRKSPATPPITFKHGDRVKVLDEKKQEVCLGFVLSFYPDNTVVVVPIDHARLMQMSARLVKKFEGDE